MRFTPLGPPMTPGVRYADGRFSSPTEAPQPIVARPKVRRRGRLLTFSLDLRDTEGGKIREIRTPQGRPEVHVVVEGPEGVVHRGRMEYG